MTPNLDNHCACASPASFSTRE